jgi:biotin carboxyl carrier protein
MKKKPVPNDTYTPLLIDDAVYLTKTNRMYDSRKPYHPTDPRKITSFMPGNIQEVFVSAGDGVEEGDKLCILEAMKMKNIIIAPMKGVVKAINVNVGERVPKNHVLIELE